jgi:hypothetical protein
MRTARTTLQHLQHLAHCAGESVVVPVEVLDDLVADLGSLAAYEERVACAFPSLDLGAAE